MKVRPFRLTDLQHEPFVACGRRWALGFYDRWVGICTRIGFSPTIVHETGEMDTMSALASAGVGVAIAPEGLLRGRSGGLAIRAQPPGAPPSEIGLARRARQTSPLLESLAALSLELEHKASCLIVDNYHCVPIKRLDR